MKSHNIDIAVIGAGPSGLVASIVAAQRGKKVTLFETNDDIGHSILKTGNGRCNYSNINIDAKKYYNNRFVENIYNQVKPSEVWKFFEELGLLSYIDNEGRMFPYTKNASTIVDILKSKIQSLNIQIITNTKVQKLNEIVSKSNKVIVCCGNKLEQIESNIKFKKLLCPILTEDKLISKLDGIKVHAKCSLVNQKNNIIALETGEILFRNYGLSGICVFNLSRFVFVII